MQPLPAEFEREFDLDLVPKDSTRPLRDTAKRVFERVDAFRKVLETALNPDSMLEMQESERLTEKERALIIELLAKIMRIDRAMLLAELENDESSYDSFLHEMWPVWQSLKKDLRIIITRLHASWDARKDVREQLHYLG